ncbi:hypothetical protein HOLleu_06467 [Holothuria leucospilota]|uniref:Uncharacterized protein n=1 Tax=Holothuria leucospilota TaxID=206669 RepID=A0A9Q1CLI9_HOLLE|nr:hypothetical protein HOLleu_06467 [Holothuria leucospilota]
MKEWLCHNIDPEAKVKEFMEKTAVKREALLRDENFTLDQIIKEFPRLFDTPGMVEVDFRTVFPDVADRLYMQWTLGFSEKVLQYATLQEKWENYLNVNSEAINTDKKKVNASLSVLPVTLPCGKKGRKKATIMDAKKSYMDVQPQIVTNIPKYLDEVTNRQPYILVLGEALDPSQVFVIVERKALEQASLLKAVDVCFKLF